MMINKWIWHSIAGMSDGNHRDPVTSGYVACLCCASYLRKQGCVILSSAVSTSITAPCTDYVIRLPVVRGALMLPALKTQLKMIWVSVRLAAAIEWVQLVLCKQPKQHAFNSCSQLQSCCRCMKYSCFPVFHESFHV